MRLFAIMTDPHNKELEKALKRDFPKRYFDFGDGQLFVAGEGTATHIYEILDKDEKLDVGSVVVMSIVGYNGYASTDLWDWMQAMSEQNG